jgi:hypothetical protein
VRTKEFLKMCLLTVTASVMSSGEKVHVKEITLPKENYKIFLCSMSVDSQ